MKNGAKKQDTTSWQAIICGVGGQGVLFINRLLALAAQEQGLMVLVSEVHGMAQRGGSVISHLRAGHFKSPLVPSGHANLLFSLDAGEAVRNIPYLASGGRLVVNAPNVNFLSHDAQKALNRHKIEVFYANADALAQQTKAPVNILMLAAAARAGFLPVSELKLQKLAAAQGGQAGQTLWKQGAALAANF